VTRRVVRTIRVRSTVVARRAGRGVAQGVEAARLARVRLGRPIGAVFAFHGVVERVEDRDVQLNHVELGAFENALAAIRARFEIVSLSDLAAALADGRSTQRPLAVLSFDDGYVSTLELVHPLLSREGLPHAVFVCPGLIDAGARLPSFVAQAAVLFARVESAALPHAGTLRLDAERSRAEEAWRVVDLVKRLPQDEVYELVEACRALLTGDEWREVDRRFTSEALLDWDGVRSLAAEGVTIGSHTLDHASMHSVQSSDVLRAQTIGARLRIEHELGSPCRVFCYPYGRYVNLSPEAVAEVAAAGYGVALTLETGTVRIGMSPLLLPRVYVGPKFDPVRLDRLLAPVRDRRFVRASRGLRLV